MNAVQTHKQTITKWLDESLVARARPLVKLCGARCIADGAAVQRWRHTCLCRDFHERVTQRPMCWRSCGPEPTHWGLYSKLTLLVSQQAKGKDSGYIVPEYFIDGTYLLVAMSIDLLLGIQLLIACKEWIPDVVNTFYALLHTVCHWPT